LKKVLSSNVSAVDSKPVKALTKRNNPIHPSRELKTKESRLLTVLTNSTIYWDAFRKEKETGTLSVVEAGCRGWQNWLKTSRNGPYWTDLSTPYVHPIRKKGLANLSKPLILQVRRDRIELPTRGFSANHPGFPNLIDSLKLLKSLNPDLPHFG
jgi:hypothetical protein